MSNDPVPKESPLSQVLESDGRPVKVELYDDGTGGCLLEVVYELDNSSVSDQSFQTEQYALAATL